jgi:hypothetical protein
MLQSNDMRFPIIAAALFSLALAPACQRGGSPSTTPPKEAIGASQQHGSGTGPGVGSDQKRSARGHRDGRPGGTTATHGSGKGGGYYGRKASAGNKDGRPGGASTEHGSGKGGGRHGHAKEASGNKDGRPGGATNAQHGTGQGQGRGLGSKGKAQGDKNAKPGDQTQAAK